MKIALARPIFGQMTSNLLHLKGMSYICVTLAQNWALSLILVLQFKNSKFRDTPFFRLADFVGPWVKPKTFLDRDTVLLYMICPDLTDRPID